jgi:hypothetical protein
MSTGYPFLNLIGNNVLDQILSPKIVGGVTAGYQVQMDLGNINTIYSTNIGTVSNPSVTLYTQKIGDQYGNQVSNLFVKQIGATGPAGATGPRVSDIYVDTLHYLNLNPIVSGGTGSGSGGIGPTGPRGSQGATGPVGPRGIQGITGSTGSQGISPTFVVLSTNTGNPGTNAQVVNVGSQQNIQLQFTIPRGDPGQAGSGSGSGTNINGPVGQIPYFVGGTGGVTSSSSLAYNGSVLTVPTTEVTTPNSIIRMTGQTSQSYLQSSQNSVSGSGNILNISPYGSTISAAKIDTGNYQVSIGKNHSPATNIVLDVLGQTTITAVTGSSLVSNVVLNQPIVSAGSFNFPNTTSTYKIYAWGQGGNGPNALAGGEAEMIISGVSGINYSYIGGGTGSYTGGSALVISYPGLSTPLYAYGGGGGSLNAGTTGSPGNNGGTTAGSEGQGGYIPSISPNSIQTFTYTASSVPVSFTSGLISNISSYATFPTGTTFTFNSVIPTQYGLVNIPTSSSTTIAINVPTTSTFTGVNVSNSQLTLVGYTGPRSMFVNGTLSFPTISASGSTANNVYVTGDGVGAISGSNTIISGENIQLLGLTGINNVSASWVGNGTVLYGSTGSISFGSTGIDEFAGTTLVLTAPSTVVFTGAQIYATGLISTSLSGQVTVGCIGFGTTSYAGDGIGNTGGYGINGGGGGGGGFNAGGGGNNSVGGNGSSFSPNGTVTNGSGVYPFLNKYNTGVYGGPRQFGGIVIEQLTSSTLGLTVNGDEVVTGNLSVSQNETIAGNLTVQGTTVNLSSAGVSVAGLSSTGNIILNGTASFNGPACSIGTVNGTTGIFGNLSVQVLKATGFSFSVANL